MESSQKDAALRLAVERLGTMHIAEEGPNAGWVTTSAPEEVWNGYYEDDLVCRADCPVCEAIEACKKALESESGP